MGISLTEYRVRIGSFSASHKKVKPWRYSTTQRTKIKNSPVQSVSVRMLLLFSLCTLSVSATCTIQHSNDHVCPTHNQANVCDFQTKSTININSYRRRACDVNFIARYTYGNRQNRGIKIASWNKGGGYLENKMLEIENVVSGLHPHILGITESNFFSHHDRDNVQLQDYAYMSLSQPKH